MFSFHVRLLIITLSSLKLHIENGSCVFLLEIVGGSEKTGFNAEDAHCSKRRPLAFKLARNRTCHWSIAWSMTSWVWDRLDQKLMRRCFSWLTPPTGVMCLVSTLLHQTPDSVVDRREKARSTADWSEQQSPSILS